MTDVDLVWQGDPFKYITSDSPITVSLIDLYCKVNNNINYTFYDRVLLEKIQDHFQVHLYTSQVQKKY